MNCSRGDEPSSRCGRRPTAEWVIGVGLLLVAILYCLPVILSGSAWGFWDWDMFEAAIEAARVSVVEHGQIPGWHAYIRGGERLEGNPLLPLASPSFLVILALGTIPGLKVCILIRQFLALWGGYLLGRRLGLSQLAGVTVGIAFGLSSTLAQRVAHGHLNLQASAYLPLLIYAGLHAVRPGAWRSRVLAAVLLALMFLDGGPYSYTVGLLGLGGLLLVALVQARTLTAPSALAIVFALSLGLSAVKLVPVFETFGSGLRQMPYEKGTMLDFYHPSFSPSLGGFLHQALLERNQANQPGVYSPYRINVGAYLGVIGVGLALFGGVIGGRIGRAALLLTVPYLWLCTGSAAPVNLWLILHELPVFSSMTVPAKFTPCYLLCLAVAAGAAIDGLDRMGNRTAVKRFGVPALVLAFGLDLGVVARPLLAQAFSLTPLHVERGEFYQRLNSPYLDAYRTGLTVQHGRRRGTTSHSTTTDFPAVLANHGILDGFSVFAIRASAKPDHGPGAPGAEQISAVGGAPPMRTRWSPNRIAFRVDPARGGILVINQNFDPNWTASSKGGNLAVFKHHGRLAVRLEPGVTEVTVAYRSLMLRWGAGFSLAAAVLALALLRLPEEGASC